MKLKVEAINKMSDQTNVSVKSAVLVVDDERAICNVTNNYLKKMNITCFIALDGDERIEIFQRRHAEIGVVILDYTMPKLSGDQVFAAMRRIDSEVKVILSSGYSEEDISGDYVQHLAGFIQKPYSIHALRKKLNEVMNRE